MLKVLYVTMQFPAPSETFATSDVKSLRKAGVDVSVSCLRSAHSDHKSLLHERQLNDISISFFKFSSLINGVAFGLMYPRRALDLVAWILANAWRSPQILLKSFLLVPRTLEIYREICLERPDVLHLFWGHYPSLVGYLVEKNKPEIVVSHFLGAYDLLLRHPCSGPVARRADVVWTHVAANLNDLEWLGLSSKKVVVCHRGINLDKFTNRQPSLRIKRRIVVSGRLVRAKRVDLAIMALKKNLLLWPDATLSILGDGPEKKTLEKLSVDLGLSQSVLFRGHVSHDRVYEELCKAEIMVMMSENERIPNAVKEAMACGCVCLVASTTGIEELIEDGVTGYVVSSNIDSLAEKISEVFSGASDYEVLRAAAWQHLNKSFNVTKSMQTYKKAWEHSMKDKSFGVTCVEPLHKQINNVGEL